MRGGGAGVDMGGPVGPLLDPSSGTVVGLGHGGWLDEQVGAVAIEFHRDAIEYQMRIANEVQMDFLPRGDRVPDDLVKVGGIGEVLHRGLVRFVTVRPSAGRVIVHGGMLQLHAAAVSVGEFRPVSGGEVIHFVHQISRGVFQAEKFARVAQLAGEISKDLDGSMLGGEPGGIGGDDQVGARVEGGAGGEGEADPVDEAPAAEVQL